MAKNQKTVGNQGELELLSGARALSVKIRNGAEVDSAELGDLQKRLSQVARLGPEESSVQARRELEALFHALAERTCARGRPRTGIKESREAFVAAMRTEVPLILELLECERAAEKSQRRGKQEESGQDIWRSRKSAALLRDHPGTEPAIVAEILGHEYRKLKSICRLHGISKGNSPRQVRAKMFVTARARRNIRFA